MKLPLALAALVLAMAGPAHADTLPLPADAPPSFKTECGSCHLPFSPRLLTAPDWKRVMNSLERHYGDNATLDETTRRDIEAFLLRNGASRSQMAAASDPPRLTSSVWFRREHRQIREQVWRDPRVKTPANCAACHIRAEAGSFRESEIVLPSSATEPKELR